MLGSAAVASTLKGVGKLGKLMTKLGKKVIDNFDKSSTKASQRLWDGIPPCQLLLGGGGRCMRPLVGVSNHMCRLALLPALL